MEQIAPSTGGRRRRQVKGRQDAAKQEKKIEIQKLDEKMDHLVSLHTACKEAGTNFSDAIKAVAESSGLQASVVRRFVAAKAGENFGDRKRDAEQLALVFDEIAG
jgi:hypothetical protein